MRYFVTIFLVLMSWGMAAQEGNRFQAAAEAVASDVTFGRLTWEYA